MNGIHTLSSETWMICLGTFICYSAIKSNLTVLPRDILVRGKKSSRGCLWSLKWISKHINNCKKTWIFKPVSYKSCLSNQGAEFPDHCTRENYTNFGREPTRKNRLTRFGGLLCKFAFDVISSFIHSIEAFNVKRDILVRGKKFSRGCLWSWKWILKP